MIKVPEHKEPQHELKTEKFFDAKKLYLPISQHTGAPSSACVETKDEVQEGQLIAKESAFISTQLHSPCRGKVLSIDNWFHPNLKRAPCIIIQPQEGKKEYKQVNDIESKTKEQLLEIIKNSGIVGLGGAAFPTHVKLNPPKEIDTLIINGCECEPYLAADYRLMIENLEEVFKGIEIICKLIKPQQVFFAVEDNKPQALKKINLLISTKRYRLPAAQTAVLKSKYPQGGEKQLINSVTNRKIPSGMLPLDVGCLVHNVGTCFAIYEAIYFNKPLMERLVSFCGDAIVSSKNIWVKIGTTLKELFDQKILEFKTAPEKIICGGPMMGVALDNLDYPILKGTGGFLFLKENVNEMVESPCIKCSRCVDVCPMDLLPSEYAKKAKKEEFSAMQDLNIRDCMECGCCAYVCPAKIPLVQYVKIGKKYLNSK